MDARALLVRPFQPTDEEEARSVLAAGFKEQFGDAYDEAGDHELDDVSAPFSQGLFLVAVVEGRVVGTGGLVVPADDAAEIRRMSTKREYRRRGVASAVLRALLDEAWTRGCRRVVLGTEAAWDDAVSFYRAHGFGETERPGSSIWFERVLEDDAPAPNLGESLT